MGKLDFLKKESKEKKKPAPDQSVDMNRVEDIVKKMKEKYKDEGVEFEEVGGKLKELRGIIAEGDVAALEVQSVEDLKEFKNPLVQKLGSFYMNFKGIAEPISNFLKKLPGVKEIDYYLYSANMHYSVNQYLAITTAAAIIATVLGFIGITIFAAVLGFDIVLAVVLIPLVTLMIFIISAVLILMLPRSNAKNRGDLVSREIPFALRHMATELKAGIGLYRTLQAIASAGYGPLSEEFARTITEVEEGVDTKLALRHLALRTQSIALRNSIMHIIRAMKTGGNLSEVMNDIAEDVSFELRMKMREFSQKINFFGVIYIFMAIVMPVVIAVLGGIRNSPVGMSGGSMFAALPLTIEVVAVIYLIALPLMLVLLIAYLKMAQPKV